MHKLIMMSLSRWIRIAVVAVLILVALFAVRIHVTSGQISTRDAEAQLLGEHGRSYKTPKLPELPEADEPGACHHKGDRPYMLPTAAPAAWAAAL